MEVSEEYQCTLLLYYEEELIGEAYLHRLRDYFLENEKLSLLADVERHAANAVLPLVK